MTKETGGPVFPQTHMLGMTLRDYFASKAMQGELASQTLEWASDVYSYVAESAYKMADAMLEARK
jgi:hypothetical protein